MLEAVRTLDREVGRLIQSAIEHDYSVILTADHGNCEELIDPVSLAPHTQHTTYPVPCMVIDEMRWQLSCEGGLANVAPTVLQLMGLQQPATMHAHSLLLKGHKASETYQSFEGAA